VRDKKKPPWNTKREEDSRITPCREGAFTYESPNGMWKGGGGRERKEKTTSVVPERVDKSNVPQCKPTRPLNEKKTPRKGSEQSWLKKDCSTAVIQRKKRGRGTER